MMRFLSKFCLGYLVAASLAVSVLGFQITPASSTAWNLKTSLTLRSELFSRSRTSCNAVNIPSVGPLFPKSSTTPSIRENAARIVTSASARDVWSVTGVGITTVNRPFGGEPGADVTTWRHDEFGTGIELWQVRYQFAMRSLNTNIADLDD